MRILPFSRKVRTLLTSFCSYFRRTLHICREITSTSRFIMAKRLRQTRASNRKSPRSTESSRKPLQLAARHTPNVSPITASPPGSTMDIIDRMSHQFRVVDDDISFKNSPRYSRKDVFLGSSSTPQSHDSSSQDCYDFNAEDEDCRLRLDLSPIKAQKTPASEREGKSSSAKKNQKRSRSASKENRSTTKSNKDSSSSKKRKVDLVAKKNAKNVKKSSPTSETQSRKKKPKDKPGKLTRGKQLGGASPGDSGVFMTPPSLIDIGAEPESTSTPAVTPAHPRLSKTKPKLPVPHAPTNETENPSSPDYEYPVSPKLSPVKKHRTPRSEELGALVTSSLYESVELGSTGEEENESPGSFKALDISRTYSSYSGLGYYDRPVSSKKKIKKSKRKSVSRYDVIADEMNKEFDDLDDFQLSID